MLGDRWSLLIVRDMMLLGYRRFKQFLNSHERIATNILSDRLRRLEKQGIIASEPDRSLPKWFCGPQRTKTPAIRRWSNSSEETNCIFLPVFARLASRGPGALPLRFNRGRSPRGSEL